MFSRRQVLQPRVLNLNSVVEKLIKMLRRLLGEKIDLATRLDPAVRPGFVDAAQMEQAIMNLAVNARDAMPNGGTLAIETRQACIEEDKEQSSLVPPGRYSVLQIRDTGTGIPSDIQERVFEPFFTTKEAGKGTGLGLSTVYGIVKQSGGQITLNSVVGEGSDFSVWLPSLADASEIGDVKTAAPSRGTETILVIEDEESVQSLVVALLQRLGYRVTAAAHPGDALRLAESRSDAFNVLLTDM